MNKKRLVELDALRGIAALSVVLYHFFYRYDEIYGHKNLSVDWSFFGQFGVHLFFIVSGFVIYWTINRIERPMDFVVSRFSRLYPTYWVAVLTTFMIVYCFGLKGREVSFEHALYNILMFQEVLRIPHVDGVYWTLTVELIFYFWVFLLFVISKLEYIEGICTSVIFISVLNTLEVVSVPIVMYKLFLMEYLPLFLAGICFYKIINEESFRIKTRVTLLFSFMALCVIHSLEYSIIFIFIYATFYLAISNRLRFVKLKPFVFLGSISYSLYLLHQNIGYVVINESYEIGMPPLVGVILALAVSIGLSTLSVIFVERPSLQYIRSKYKNSVNLQKLATKFQM